MTLVVLGDIGDQHPMNYLYQCDLKHPSVERCHCGRHLHIAGSTSSLPVKWYYQPKCIYHWASASDSEFQYISKGKKYRYDVKTGSIRELGYYSPLLGY